MTNVEFVKHMQRLCDRFGKTIYGSELTKLIWNEVNRESEAWFDKTVSNFIGSLRQAPILPDFKDAARDERFRKHEANKTNVVEFEQRKYECSDCAGLGYFVCLNKTLGGFWPFRCRCVAGSHNSKKFPEFKQGHADAGFYLANNLNKSNLIGELDVAK